MDTTRTFAEELQEGFLQGPPQEICMVLDGDRLRPFNEAEDGIIGTRIITSDRTGPSEMPLYGLPEPGWKLVLED